MSDSASHVITCPWSIEELVPHAAPMILLERVIAVSQDSLTAEAVMDQRSPFYSGESELPAWWCVEYLAQGIAALAGWRRRSVGKEISSGFLTSCRQFNCSRPGIPMGSTVTVAVDQVVMVGENLAAFQCKMTSDVFTAQSLITVYGVGAENA